MTEYNSELKKKLLLYRNAYNSLCNQKLVTGIKKLVDSVWFLENEDILIQESYTGEARFPYSSGRFNLWCYSSGFMHCNEGLFSPFLQTLEGSEPKIAFFVRLDNKKGEKTVYSLLDFSSNLTKECSQFTVFSMNAAYYITLLKECSLILRVFVPESGKIVFSVYAENTSEERLEIQISSYFNPYISHSIHDNCESKWFKESRYLGENELGNFLITSNEDISRTVSLQNACVVQRGLWGEDSTLLSHAETTSRQQYVGSVRGTSSHPAVVALGKISSPIHTTAMSAPAVAADLLTLRLEKGKGMQEDILVSSFSFFTDIQMIQDLAHAPLQQDTIENMFVHLPKNMLEVGFSFKQCGFADTDTYNTFLKYLVRQVEFCSRLTGYVQLSERSLIGFRDIFQALEAYLLYDPPFCRSKMLEALEFVDEKGLCPRQYMLSEHEGMKPVMDLRPFIDQGVWCVDAFIWYYKYTKDASIFQEMCGYWNVSDSAAGLVERSSKCDSALDHLIKIVDFLLQQLDTSHTGCLKTLYGDWNDALDGLGVSNRPGEEFGTGVSVMATLQLYHNLRQLCGLLRTLGGSDYNGKMEEYERAGDELALSLQKQAIVRQGGARRILHGWGDKKEYLVGSFCDIDGESRDGLTANAFWILSGMYDLDPSIRKGILKAFQALDSPYGFKTFEPYFKKETKGIGRIGRLPKGTAENGGTYIHASAFAVMALFRIGEAKLAWEQLKKLMPFSHNGHISGSPFVMPNSYGYNLDLNIDGYSLADWQTGCSNVILKILTRYVVGVCPDFDGIRISPANCLPFDSFSAQLQIRGCNLSIKYQKAQGNAGIHFLRNGVLVPYEIDVISARPSLWLSDEVLTERQLCIEIREEVEAECN